MRADRLVAVLMLLQTRGQVTAAQIAEELEVSERTARRDLEALGMAGVPVYSTQGRNGGWRLVGGARTDLSGLTASEARALFLVAGPSSAATPELKTALRKLVRALPEPFRQGAEAASAAVVVDPTDWGRRAYHRPTPPHLEAVQKAVVDAEQVVLGYVARDRSATERVVHPLGLATKKNTWYLVADTDRGLRTFRVDRITSVEPTGEPVTRPEGFDLEESWRLVTERVDREWQVWARAVVDPDIVPTLRSVFGTRIRIGPPQADARIEVEVGGWHQDELAGHLAGFGRAVHVLEPLVLRERLAFLGSELTDMYG